MQPMLLPYKRSPVIQTVLSTNYCRLTRQLSMLQDYPQLLKSHTNESHFFCEASLLHLWMGPVRHCLLRIRCAVQAMYSEALSPSSLASFQITGAGKKALAGGRKGKKQQQISILVFSQHLIWRGKKSFKMEPLVGCSTADKREERKGHVTMETTFLHRGSKKFNLVSFVHVCTR